MPRRLQNGVVAGYAALVPVRDDNRRTTVMKALYRSRPITRRPTTKVVFLF